MKGARVVAGWMLILIAVCLVPAVSAAQDTETATTPEPAANPPEPAANPPEPAANPPEPAADPVVELGETPADAEPAEQQIQAEPAPTPPPAPAPATRSGQARASASASVSIGDNFYSPASVSIGVGDTVTWANNGQAQHSATADNGSFDTGVFGPGVRRSNTFTQAGTFSYHCTVHGQAQSGTVRVLAASGGGGSGGGGGPTTSATEDSEAAAVASPDAAGTSTTLPATGMAAGVLTLVGLALVASGSLVGRAGATRDRQTRFLTMF
ncbi:MAG TPA: plastocyanin/azurin family copper-binding protein [Solirubrobacterales bacterium]|nr:plastocyanin/azurin family copper-binding protein [Solirubrobacterales bacterium]